MDGAPNLNKSTDTVSSVNHCAASCETNVQPVVSSSLQESVATSRLSTLLSSLVEPLSSGKMPQQSSPCNTSGEEKASLPRPVPTPTFPIPPHVMGRNVDNPAEDLVAHGRRLQKPRLGVRVPYRNLTSQIVTQDELAQELLERSLKKHPVHDTPEGGDLFFAIKLTQRLANRLAPASAQSSPPSVPSPGKPLLAQSATEANTSVTSDNTVALQTTSATEHGDLLAILEGEVDPDWVPDTKKTESTLNVEPVPPTSLSHSHTKLDPLLEKELALKQLMEFQTNSRRKKSEKSLKAAVSRKQRSQAKKETIKKENGAVNHGSPLDSENNNGTSGILSQGDVNQSANSTPKPTRKRKVQNDKSLVAKRQRLVKKAMSLSGGKTKPKTVEGKKKTEPRIARKVKSAKGSGEHFVVDQQRISVVNLSPQEISEMLLTGKSVSPSGVKPKKSESKKCLEMSSKKKVPNSGTNTNASPVKRTSEQVVGPGGSLSGTPKSEDVSSIADGLLDLPRNLTVPLRTYSPKKRVNSTGNVPKTPDTKEKTSAPTVLGELQPDVKMEENAKQLVVASPVLKQVSAASLSEGKEVNSPGSPIKQSAVPLVLSKEPSSPSVKQSSEVLTSSVTPKQNVSPTSPSKHQLVGSPTSASLKSVVIPSATVSKPATSPSSPRKRKEAKDAIVDPGKKRRMGEVDRLLMDEGAINLLYEAEHGDSKRRSNVPEDGENAQTSQRRILKSVRRKKKDLLLKTRLVKNAVLRLSSSPSTLSPVASRTKRRVESTGSSGEGTVGLLSPQRKLSFDSHDSLRSPPPLTPIDPPSPQSFVYPPRLSLPAEASRIIRRHSSSSNFSSRSASPSNTPRGGDIVNMEAIDTANDVKSGSGSRGNIIPEGRKKGVPIFVRKPQNGQTYKGKKKKEMLPETKLPDSNTANNVSQLPAQNNKDSKTITKEQIQMKDLPEKKKFVVVKKISLSDKLKLKAEMSKNFQKGFQTAKLKLKKPAESASTKAKKKDDTLKEKLQKPESSISGSTAGEEESPDLSSCLAAAASAFAAEAQEEKSSKKSSGSSSTSHSSSPCPSRSSKSPTPTGRLQPTKKEPRLAAPLSPNASSYSNLLKSLENENQKQRKKDGEESTKQRSSVRQNAGTFHYKEISLRRYDNLVQIILTPQSTKMKNALNLQVLREMRDALHQLKRDETCRAVLLTSTGSSFCQGLDFYCLLHTNAERRKSAAQELAQALKEFMKCLALFNKPIVAGVHGAAVGLGVTMLPFFDMVFASDKATFYTPYAKLGQVPEGAAILTLPHMFGNAVTSELLFGCRKLTASEALHFGLVTRILWPDRFLEELIPIIRGMANQSSQSMEATKALLRHSLRTKLDAALESESHLLVQHWISSECQASFKRFLDDEDVGLQRQRVEA